MSIPPVLYHDENYLYQRKLFTRFKYFQNKKSFLVKENGVVELVE